MNPAQVLVFGDTAEERADREITPGIRISHLHRVDLPEIGDGKIGAGNPGPVLAACPEESEYILSPGFQPRVEIFDSRCYSVTEDLATEPALEAFIRVLFWMVDRTISW